MKLSDLTRHHLILGFCCLYLTSLVYSPFLLSISMFALAILSLCRFTFSGRGVSLGIDPDAIKKLRRPTEHPEIVVMAIFFLIVLLDFWQTEDYVFWLKRLRVKAPLLGLPLVFLILPRFEKRHIFFIHSFLLILLCVTSAWIGIHYVLHYETVNLMVRQGQPVPVPGNHIRLSLLMVYGIFGGAWLFFQKRNTGRVWEKYLVPGMTIFVFIILHVTAVRTGLLAFYFTLFCLLIRFVYLSKRVWLGALLFTLLLCVPVIGYRLSPSLKLRMDYMRYGLMMHDRGEGATYSDSGRIASFDVGCMLASENPFFGVGAGNMRQAVKTLFAERYPRMENPLLPHNQFLYVLAAQGLVGLIFFLFAFWLPLFYRQRYRHHMVLTAYMIFFVAFMTDHTIEAAAGVAFYAFFVLLWMNHYRGEMANQAYPRRLGPARTN